jgi:hypothetical protein
MMRAEAARGLVLVAVVIVEAVVVVVMLLRRETRGYDAARSERVVGRQVVVGSSKWRQQQQQAQAQQALSRWSVRLVRCLACKVVPPCQCLPLAWAQLAGSRGGWAGAERDETRRDEGRVDGALEGRGTRHEVQGAIG